ncbi:MAG: tannase/feruloyl esterase family alpha/beta hydrolase, partial [Chitinophagaceae bacterium]
MKIKKILVTVILLIFHAMFTTVSFGQFFLQLTPLPSPIKPVYGAITPVCGCETLTKVSIPNTIIISAAVDPKDGSCKVTAIVNHPPADDSVTVWIALPEKNWNGRFEGRGGGGFLGGDPQELAEPVSQGFAAGATNTGHQGGSGSFALDTLSHRLNWQLVRDNVYQGIHDMTIVGKTLVKSFYGKPARYTYFVGNSTGGRQGLSEAQRFPNDYDGVLSYQPAINWDRMLIALLWPQVAMQEANDYPSAEKFKAINNAVIGVLDGKDGTMDSIIDDPLHHQIDPKSLIGKKVGDSVFTEADAELIRKIWEGPRTHDGKFLWYGLLPGADLTSLTGTKGSSMSGRPFSISVDWVRYFLYLDPKWTGIPLTQTEFELLWNQSVEQYGKLFGTDDPDLT